nr:MAG TPA: hypothetical protein [Caudoviricetes sp.]
MKSRLLHRDRAWDATHGMISPAAMRQASSSAGQLTAGADITRRR